jgi:hypothetical protein
MATTLDHAPLSRREAAAFLGITPGTLARWAMEGKGPRYARSGKTRGKVWYSVADLTAWLEAHKQEKNPTMPNGAQP